MDQQFKVVSNFKYLGNFLTFNLDDENDINSKLNSLNLLIFFCNLM